MDKKDNLHGNPSFLNVDDKCRTCHEFTLCDGCSMLVQTSYLKRHFYYRFCYDCGIDSEDHLWYDSDHVQGIKEKRILQASMKLANTSLR